MKDAVDTVLELVEYELETSLKLLEFLATVPEKHWHQDFGFGLRTPHHTLFHIASVIRTWSACVGPDIQKPEPLAYDPHLSLDGLREMFKQLGESWRKAIHQSHSQGILNEDRRLHQVFHLITHGHHHRGQFLSMVTLMGYPQPMEGGDFGGWSNREDQQD